MILKGVLEVFRLDLNIYPKYAECLSAKVFILTKCIVSSHRLGIQQ